MKYLIALFLCTFLLNGNAQNNMNDLATTWEDGVYTWFGLNSETHSARVQFFKNDYGHVSRIKINDDWFEPADENTQHIRYYKPEGNGGANNLYFVKNAIIVFTQNRNETFHRIRATVGVKDVSWKKMDERISKDQIKGKEILAQLEASGDVSLNSMADVTVKSIEIKLITESNEPLKAADDFTIGVISTLSDGRVLKTKNLGGLQKEEEFRFTVTGAKHAGVDNYVILPCIESRNAEVVVTASSTVSSQKFDAQSIPFDCGGSASGTAYTKMWSNYDKVTFYEYTGNGHKAVTVERKKLEERGVDDYTESLQEMNGQYVDIDYLKVEKDGKFGFVNKACEVLVPVIYDEINHGFSKGWVKAKKDDLFGWIKIDGTEQLQVAYSEIGDEINGYYRVVKNGKVGFVDTDANVIIPTEYQDASEYISEGMVGVMKNNKAGFVDLKNEVVIPLQYQSVYPYSYGMACVKIDGTWGFIDVSGTLVIKNQFNKPAIMKPLYEGWIPKAYMYADDKPGYYADVYNNGTVNWNKSTAGGNYEEEGEVVAGTNYKKQTTLNAKKPTTCSLINDLSYDQQSRYGDVRLVFDNWSTNSKSLSRGKELEVPCDDVVIWKGELGSNSSQKVEKLTITTDKCGETIRLSDYW